MEAVFGQMKSNNKFQRFTMKGLEKVSLEFLLMAIGHNLRKMAVYAGVATFMETLKERIGTVFKKKYCAY